jgi:hypothetical protein
MNVIKSAQARALILGVAIFVTSVGITASPGGSRLVSAAPRLALINGDSVSGAPSQEEQIAAAAGFTVTVVPDTTWATMTAAEFGAYDLLIVGDPTCGSVPAGVITSAPVWGSVVLGHAGGRTSTGNRVIVGTDPVFHDGGDFTSPDARGTIIREGIGFAGAVPGTTGIYYDGTCGGTDVATLDAMSAGIGTWTINSAPPCGGSVSLIASHPSFADLTTASLAGWFCSVHESFPTFPSDWSALAVATDTSSLPTCGVDPHTGLGACGEAYLLVSGTAIVVNSLVISVSPLDATNPVGTSHTVTANVHDVSGAPPVAGQHVDFSVTGVNAGATGVCAPVDCISGADGNVAFTYSDANGAGDDTIKASFTDAVGSLQTATAQKHWTGVVAVDDTSTTYGGDATVQYSDSAQLSATLLDTTTATPLPGATLNFTLGTQSASAVTDATGVGSTPLVVTQMPGSVASVDTAYAGDATHAASSDSDPFSIALEDCSVTYTGDTAATSPTATTLSAQFGELDASPGDWSNKTVTFTVVDSALVSQTFPASTNAAGVASIAADLAPGTYTISTAFAGDAFYSPCAGTDASVTVAAPAVAAAHVSGRGELKMGDKKAEFAFEVDRDTAGVLKGLTIVEFRDRKGRKGHDFRSMVVETLETSGNTATFTGTGKIEGKAGYSFIISVVDNRMPGERKKPRDLISITIMKGADTVFTTVGFVPVREGDVKVG